jgi:hypothetical protein
VQRHEASTDLFVDVTYVHALNGVCAPHCRLCPGYPSRRWKAQQAFCIGVSAADAESLMMWDDEDGGRRSLGGACSAVAAAL